MATSNHSHRHALHSSESAHRHETIQPPAPHRRIPIIPDFRFERSYLKSIAPYVKMRQITQAGEEAIDVDSVDWKAVVWVTARDQIISYFLQGAVWDVLNILMRPVFANVAAFLGFRRRKDVDVRTPPRRLADKDSEFLRRLRQWSKTLTT